MTTSLDAVTTPATTDLSDDEIKVLGSALRVLGSLADRHSAAAWNQSTKISAQYHGRMSGLMDAAGGMLTNALIAQQVYGLDTGAQTALDMKHSEES
jgi:hypothetical protein